MSETLPVPERPAHLWKPGQSGNPAGRPKGSKNHLSKLKQELEIAVRENMNSAAVGAIVQKMYELAVDGNVGAAKLLLDKVITNATGSEDATESTGEFIFRIKNLTVNNTPESPEDDRVVIDVTPTPQETENVRE